VSFGVSKCLWLAQALLAKHRAAAAAAGLPRRPELPGEEAEPGASLAAVSLGGQEPASSVSEPVQFTANETVYLSSRRGVKGVLQIHRAATPDAR